MTFRDVAQARWVITTRRVFAEIIAWLPLNSFRCAAYRVLGYNIHKSRIGFGTVIAIEALKMRYATIGRRNKIVGPFSMRMETNSAIGSDNTIWCDFWPLDHSHTRFDYKREFVMEKYSLLTKSHQVDVVDRVQIGAGTHVAGIGSQFWTHGHSSDERSIEIGVDCFIGSGCIFTPGSGVQDRSIVGAGSVVTKKHREPFVLLSGNPAKLERRAYYWRSRTFFDAAKTPPLPRHLIGDAINSNIADEDASLSAREQ